MGNNSVIIASTAGCLVTMLCDMLRDTGFRVLITNNDNDLIHIIKTSYPRYIFIEHCFMDNTTDSYIQKIIKAHSSLHIVIWTADELSGDEAARFIYAGAESFFTLREKYEKIEAIFNRFLMGKKYCPDVVEALLVQEKTVPIIGVPLTNREMEIVKLCKKKDREIADFLSMALNTVLCHKVRIYRKLGIHSKVELVSYAKDNSYIIK